MSDAQPITLIQPSHGFSLRLQELWQFREVTFFLTWRDIKVRYKQTVLGVAWAILQPLLTMIIFTIVFGRIAKLPSQGLPYPVFAYVALIPWTFFAAAQTQAANSLIANAGLLRKVYLPRLVLPVSAVLSSAVDLACSLLLLLVLLPYYDVPAASAIVWVPLFVLLAFIAAMGVGTLLAALNIAYRDVRYILPLVTQLWLFATPVAYSIEQVDPAWRVAYALNPLVGVVEGFRWAVLGTSGLTPEIVATSALSAGLFLVVGVCYFRRMERTFADRV